MTHGVGVFNTKLRGKVSGPQYVEPLEEMWTFESDDDTDYRSVLDISVPRGSTLDIESTNAPITIAGTTGEIQIETVNGAVKVTGGGGEVRIESLTGDIDYSGPAHSVDAETVSGAVPVVGVAVNDATGAGIAPPPRSYTRTPHAVETEP